MSLWSEPRPFPGQDPFVVPFEGDLLLIQSTLADTRISILRFRDLAHMHNFKEFHVWAPGRRSAHTGNAIRAWPSLVCGSTRGETNLTLP